MIETKIIVWSSFERCTCTKLLDIANLNYVNYVWCRLRCLERLLADTADFGVFKAEDLFLVPFLNHANAGNLVITNEMRQSMNR